MKHADRSLPAIMAAEVQPRPRKSAYPEPFASQMAGREKRALGDVFGLTNFGVNLTRLLPGSVSALRHAHARQDEFVFVLQGTLTLRTDHGTQTLVSGMCVGFPAGTGNAHHLRNECDVDAVYLEVGDRTAGDSVFYPDDDLKAEAALGAWVFAHKNGEPYA